MFAWAEALKTFGNEVDHGAKSTISRQDATDVLEFTEALAEYVSPAEIGSSSSKSVGTPKQLFEVTIKMTRFRSDSCDPNGSQPSPSGTSERRMSPE